VLETVGRKANRAIVQPKTFSNRHSGWFRWSNFALALAPSFYPLAWNKLGNQLWNIKIYRTFFLFFKKEFALLYKKNYFLSRTKVVFFFNLNLSIKFSIYLNLKKVSEGAFFDPSWNTDQGVQYQRKCSSGKTLARSENEKSKKIKQKKKKKKRRTKKEWKSEETLVDSFQERKPVETFVNS
jgi:hypothetical protein